MVLGYQIGGQTSTGALPADPRKRWRCLFVDEIDHVADADPATAWQTADNYNPSRPFNAIDHLSVAIGPGQTHPDQLTTDASPRTRPLHHQQGSTRPLR